MLYFLGEEAISSGGLICMQKQYLIVATNTGAAYFLFYTFTILLYSVVMYYVFYKIPFKYNLVAFQRLGVKKVDVNNAGRTLSFTTKEQDNDLNELLAAEQEA
jgi:hypothetical protein